MSWLNVTNETNLSQPLHYTKKVRAREVSQSNKYNLFHVLDFNTA